MKTSKTFSILFWINASRAKNNEAEIYARITVDRKRVNISLKRKVNVNLWDISKKRVKGHTTSAKQINNYLDQTYTNLFQVYQDLKYKGELITAQLIKATYLGENENSKTLQHLINYHSKKIEKTLSAGTIRNFGVTENYINRFLEKELNTTDVFLKQLDYKFLCDFESFLSGYWPTGHPKALSHNTVMKHIQRLRKIVTLAYHMEWLDRDPFVRWKPTFEKKQREFLTANELSNLENHYFQLERLERVRDLFVFSCYTGISYIDIMQLSNENIIKGIDGTNWIVTHRQKTKTRIKIPLLEKAQELVTKYEDHPMAIVSGTLFPVITNEKLNVYLKDVALSCGIKKNLTFHMARHTFATTVTLSNGVPIETVSKLLGHTKLSTTQIYARVLEDKINEDINALRSVLKSQKETVRSSKRNKNHM